MGARSGCSARSLIAGDCSWLLKALEDFLITDLCKVGIELADAEEQRRHLQNDGFVDLRLKLRKDAPSPGNAKIIVS
jgi:hypothetical protein